MKRFASLLIMCCYGILLWGQTIDTISTKADSSRKVVFTPEVTDSPAEKKRWLKRLFDRSDYPNPKKALLFSYMMPGGGQIYNKKLWYLKVPIIWGGMGLMINQLAYNTRQFRQFRDAYLAAVDGDESTTHPLMNSWDSNSLRGFRNQFRTQMEKTWVFLFLVHSIQALEAFVQAHLLTFDVSDDLGLQIKPTLETGMMGVLPTTGIGVRLFPQNTKTPAPKPFDAF